MTTLPTIHLNGTSRGDLHAAYMDALIAIEEAIKALRKCAPHGRDYYPQGEDAIAAAVKEHVCRLNYLKDIHNVLEILCLATMPQE